MFTKDVVVQIEYMFSCVTRTHVSLYYKNTSINNGSPPTRKGGGADRRPVVTNREVNIYGRIPLQGGGRGV